MRVSQRGVRGREVATGRVRVSGWDDLRIIFEIIMRVKVNRESSTCERRRARGGDESVVLKSACDSASSERYACGE